MALQTKTSHARVSAVFAVLMVLLCVSCSRGFRRVYPPAGPDRMSGSWTNAADYIDGTAASPYVYSACVIRFQNGDYVYVRFLKANLRQAVVECGTLTVSEDACFTITDSATNDVTFSFDHGVPKFVCGGHSILWFAPNTVLFWPDMAEAAIVSERLLHQGTLSTNLIEWIKVDIPPM